MKNAKGDKSSGAFSGKARYSIPVEFEKDVAKGILIISGVGRSGTTILGKIAGSMRGACYIFEPAMIKLLPFMNVMDPSNSSAYTVLFKSILIEDYLLPALQARSLNFNREDDSYYGNYMDEKTVRKRWKSLSGRNDLRGYFDSGRIIFVIKTPEFQPLFPLAKKMFPGAGFMHIIRNGVDVVSSSIARGWFTDRYMRSSIVDWVEKSEKRKKCNSPWYLDEESKDHFDGWDALTRAACVWRSLTEQGMEFCRRNGKSSLEFRYEDFVRSPADFTGKIEKKFKMKKTRITERHMRSVCGHRYKEYPDISGRIQGPEKEKFLRLMDKLGYVDRGRKGLG